MYKKITKFSFFAILAIFAIGCSDENALSAVEDKIDDEVAHQEWKMSYDQRQSSSSAEEAACFYGTSTHTDSWCCKNYGYQCYKSSSSTSEANACYYGTSTHSDYWCCTNYGYQCNSYSSSSYYYYYSSSSAPKSYLETSKSIKLTLTYFYTSGNWDDLGAGDPEISFTIYAITSDGFEEEISTGLLLDKDNTKSWSGTSSVTKTIPVLTTTIKVCPEVIDEDISYDDDYSSGYCYSIFNIGYLEDYDVQYQSDYNNTDCTVKWHWYLY